MKTKIYEHVKASWKIYGAFVAAGVLCTEVDATAITKMSTNTQTITNLVKGPVGEAALIIGSLGGAFGAFMKGNMWLAIGIFMVGILFSWHLDNISSMFPAIASKTG